VNDAHASISTIVVGGYLGAGKTTLINHALATADGRRVGVVVNDFGALNIDASLLASDDTIELANGCVCCTLADGLPVAFERLLAQRPALDAIVVEASGVADPRKIAGYAKLAGLRAPHVVVVVDAGAIRSLQRDRFVAGEIDRQIRSAGLLVLNKRDSIDDAAAADIRQRLLALSPQARILESAFGKVTWADLLEAPDSLIQRVTHDDVQHDDDAYESWSIVIEAPLQRTTLERFGRAIAPIALRAKGIVALRDDRAQRYAWQWTPQAISLEPAGDWGNDSRQSSIVVVGRGACGLASTCAALARTHLLGDPT
jgi:G3E family GTPase